LVKPKGPVAERIVAIVAEMIDDGPSDFGLDTRLAADLEWGSIDIIFLVQTIEEHFNRPRMGFQELLMRGNRYVDVTIGQLAEFVRGKLGGG
jgi:acyl carrier protein